MKKSLSPAEPLDAIHIDIATEIQIEDGTDDFVVLDNNQFEEIQQFLADPAVVSLIRLRFMQRLAPEEALSYLDEIANLTTFQQLVHAWCGDRSQTWSDLAEHLWIGIERSHELLLKRIQLSGTLTEGVSDLLINRFFFGQLGASTAPEHARLINELAHSPDRQQQLTELLSDCDRKTRAAVNDEFMILGLQDDRAKFDDLYVDRTLVDAVTGEVFRASRHLNIRQACPRVVVIGDPGVGKSTLTSWAKWKIASDASHAPSPVVVTLVSRYDLTDTASTILSAIKRHFQSDFLIDCDDKLLAYLFATGWITLIVDGIDEVPDLSQRRRIVEQLNTMAETYPSLPIICTTRRTGFEIALFRAPLFSVLKLDSYSPEQVAEYANKWFASTDLKADRFLGESKTLGDLIKNPLLLALLCTLYRQYDYIPESRRELYLRCASLMFYEWDPRRGIAIPNLFKKEGEAILREVALMLLRRGGVGASIDESQLLAIIKHYLENKGQEPVTALNAAQELLEYCSRRAWILSKIGSQGGISYFSFTHRTFYEFFAAEAIIRNLNHQHALARQSQQADMQGGYLGPVSRTILEAFETDETSVMPELILQAADDLMGGMSTPILDELLRTIPRSNRSRRSHIVGLCIRLVAAGGAHTNVVDRVFDAATVLWVQESNEPDGNANVSLSVFRALLNISSGHRTRFIARCLDDIKGLGRYFLLRYARLSLVGEAGLYSDEWRECAMSVMREVRTSADEFEIKYRWLTGALSLDDAAQMTDGRELLLLTVDDHEIEGILWDSFNHGGMSKERRKTWTRAYKSLVSDDQLLEQDIAAQLSRFAERASGVEGVVVDRRLALFIAVMMPRGDVSQLARITGRQELMKFDEILTELLAARTVIQRMRASPDEKKEASLALKQAKQRYSKLAGEYPPKWVMDHLVEPVRVTEE